MSKLTLVEAGRAYLMALIATVVIGALLLAVAAVRPKTFWTPDGADLARSIEGSGDTFWFPKGCQSTGNETWSCAIEDDYGSGISGDDYLVRLGADNCWTATRHGKYTDTPRRLEGCIDSFFEFVDVGF